MKVSRGDDNSNTARCAPPSSMGEPSWEDTDSDSGEYDFIRDTRPVSAPPPATAPPPPPPFLLSGPSPHPGHGYIRPSTALGVQSVPGTGNRNSQKKVTTSCTEQTGSQQVTFRVVFMGQGNATHKAMVRQKIAEGLVEQQTEKCQRNRSRRPLSAVERKHHIVVRDKQDRRPVEACEDHGLMVNEADFTWNAPTLLPGIPSVYAAAFHRLASPIRRSEEILAYIEAHTHPLRRVQSWLHQGHATTRIDLVVYFYQPAETSVLGTLIEKDMQVLSKMRALNIPVLPILPSQKEPSCGQDECLGWLQKYSVACLNFSGIRPESPTFCTPTILSASEILSINQFAAIPNLYLGPLFEPSQSRRIPSHWRVDRARGILVPWVSQRPFLLTLVPLLILLSVLGWYFSGQAPTPPSFPFSFTPQPSLATSARLPLRPPPPPPHHFFPPVLARVQPIWQAPDISWHHHIQLQLVHVQPESVILVLTSSNGVKLGEWPMTYMSNTSYYTATVPSPCLLSHPVDVSASVVFQGSDRPLNPRPITLRHNVCMGNEASLIPICPLKDRQDVGLWRGTNAILAWVQWVMDMIRQWHGRE